jgi:hypothetical protein
LPERDACHIATSLDVTIVRTPSRATLSSPADSRGTDAEARTTVCRVAGLVQRIVRHSPAGGKTKSL